MGSSRRCVPPGRNWMTCYGGDCSARWITNRSSGFVCSATSLITVALETNQPVQDTTTATGSSSNSFSFPIAVCIYVLVYSLWRPYCWNRRICNYVIIICFSLLFSNYSTVFFFLEYSLYICFLVLYVCFQILCNSVSLYWFVYCI